MVPVSRKIANPLAAATKRLQALADGNLSDKVARSNSNDETGILTDALSKTIDSLKKYIQDIESCLSTLSSGDYTVEIPDDFRGDFVSIRDSLGNITVALNRTMMQMNHSSAEVSNCAKQLMDGSRAQTSLLQDMEENMEAITLAIEKIRAMSFRLSNAPKWPARRLHKAAATCKICWMPCHRFILL